MCYITVLGKELFKNKPVKIKAKLPSLIFQAKNLKSTEPKDFGDT